MKHFLGKDGFIWFLGEVVSTNDPEHLGRCKVRCFGYHDDPNIPFSALPWAVTIFPANTPNLFAVPKVGEWVFGFFLDADHAREPAILGYLPTLNDSEFTRSFKYAKARKDRFPTSLTGQYANEVFSFVQPESNNIFEIIGSNDTLTQSANTILIQHGKSNSKISVAQDGKITIETSNNISVTVDSQNITFKDKKYTRTFTQIMDEIAEIRALAAAAAAAAAAASAPK